MPERLSLGDPSAPFRHRSWRYVVRRRLRRSRELIGDNPVFLPVILRATAGGTSRRITAETELVIEGYPRSGNTFAYFAFQQAQLEVERKVNATSHVHTPSQVKLAVDRRVPTLVVVRRPIDTIVSLLIACPHVRFEAAMREYVHHHRQLLPLVDRLVIATFNQVTTDFGAVTQRVNDRFGTDFACFSHTPFNTELVFDAIDDNHAKLHGGAESVAPRPSELRAEENNWLLEQLGAPRYRQHLADAQATYDVLAAFSAR